MMIAIAFSRLVSFLLSDLKVKVILIFFYSLRVLRFSKVLKNSFVDGIFNLLLEKLSLKNIELQHLLDIILNVIIVDNEQGCSFYE